MAVVIRMKRMGRKNRAFYRICATDKRSPRDGRVIEEIGTYDPHVADTDARCTIDGQRLAHWISKGAIPSDAVRILIKKYGPSGTHVTAMEQARARLSMPRIVPDPGPPAFVPEARPEPATQGDATAVAVAVDASAGEPAAGEAGAGGEAVSATEAVSSGEAVSGESTGAAPEAAAGDGPAAT